MIKFVRVALVAAAGLSLSGCAAVFDGTTQKISVNSTPPGASCDFVRKGEVIATISSTPGTVKVDKTKEDIFVMCRKEGYQDVTVKNHSGVAGATFGDIAGGVLTGGIAWAVDSGTGADNKYDGTVIVTLHETVASGATGTVAAGATGTSSPVTPTPASMGAPQTTPATAPQKPATSS